MKLAEALALRADMQERLASLDARIRANARYQEGDQPSEDATALLAEYDRIAAAREELVAQINSRNLATEVEPGLTLTSAIARRDRLRQQIHVRQNLANAAGTGQSRLTRSELRFVSAVDVRALRQEIDDLSRQLRELDTKMQAVNWTTDL